MNADSTCFPPFLQFAKRTNPLWWIASRSAPNQSLLRHLLIYKGAV
jgi:hypothetical protein